MLRGVPELLENGDNSETDYLDLHLLFFCVKYQRNPRGGCI